MENISNQPAAWKFHRPGDCRVSRLKMLNLLIYPAAFTLFGITLCFTACGDGSANEPYPYAIQKYSEIEEKSFSVSDSSTLTIENFVGIVTVRTGNEGTIRVKATKYTPFEEELEMITIDMIEENKGPYIKTGKPSNLHEVAVDLDITTPATTRMDINIGVGDVDYQGRPQGTSIFDVGVGTIRLRLPADIGVIVELSVGVGQIDLGFTVDGVVSQLSVSGTVGNGDEGEIIASIGVGEIYLIRQ